MPTAGQDLQNSQFNNEMEFNRQKAVADQYNTTRARHDRLPKARENSYTETGPPGSNVSTTRYKYFA
jgi:hypothetical protein